MFFNRVNWEEQVAKSKLTDAQASINSTEAPSNDIRVHQRSHFLLLYICITTMGIIGYISRSFSFFWLCQRISNNFHDVLFWGITRAKMIFFNNNPSGRILNRFVKDINNVDSILPNIMIIVLGVSSHRKELQSSFS